MYIDDVFWFAATFSFAWQVDVIFPPQFTWKRASSDNARRLIQLLMSLVFLSIIAVVLKKDLLLFFSWTLVLLFYALRKTSIASAFNDGYVVSILYYWGDENPSENQQHRP